MHAISNPLSPGNRGLRVVLSRHFCASLHVGHARSIRPVFDYRITGVEAEIKTNKQNKGNNILSKVIKLQNLKQYQTIRKIIHLKKANNILSKAI